MILLLQVMSFANIGLIQQIYINGISGYGLYYSYSPVIVLSTKTTQQSTTLTPVSTQQSTLISTSDQSTVTLTSFQTLLTNMANSIQSTATLTSFQASLTNIVNSAQSTNIVTLSSDQQSTTNIATSTQQSTLTLTPISIQAIIYIHDYSYIYNDDNILFNLNNNFSIGVGISTELYPQFTIDTQNINLVLMYNMSNNYYKLNVVYPGIQFSTLEVGFKLFSW